MAELIFDLRTDYTPAVDFHRIEVIGFDPRTSDVKYGTRGVGRDEDFDRGRRVTTLFGVPGGHPGYNARLVLLNGDGVPIADSSTLIRVVRDGRRRVIGRRSQSRQIIVVVIGRR